MIRRAARLALALVLAAAGTAARAGTATAPAFTVTATVNKVCTITAPTTVDLGAFDPQSGTKSTTGSIVVACTKGASYTVTLASANAWQLKDGSGNALPYSIYQPDATGAAATTTLWNESSKYTNVSASHAAKPLAMTAQVVAGDVPAGTYTDQVTASVDF